jgi:hypothetical protein
MKYYELVGCPAYPPITNLRFEGMVVSEKDVVISVARCGSIHGCSLVFMDISGIGCSKAVELPPEMCAEIDELLKERTFLSDDGLDMDAILEG